MTRASAFLVQSVFAVLLFAFAAPALADGVEYTLDPDHTQVQFSWEHLGFSRPSAQFNQVTGTLHWDQTDPAKSSVNVTMPVDSIDSHVPLLDKKLRSDAFFDAAKYPQVTFKSRSVQHGDKDDHYLVKGDLTVHGVTHPVVLDVTLNKSGEHAIMKAQALGFHATTSFKRSVFGMDKFVPLVSDEIQVDISTEAIESRGYQKALEREAEQKTKSK